MLYLFPGLMISWLVFQWGVRARKDYQANQDARLKHVQDLLANLRTVKALAWEKLFVARIREARDGELSAIQAYAVSLGMLMANMHTTLWFMTLASLYLYTANHGAVEARHLWVVFQIMASLQACSSLVSAGLRKTMNLPSSLARIEAFLKLPERPAGVVRAPADRPEAPLVQVCGCFSYEEAAAPVLSDLDLSVARGEVVAVVGCAGAG
eukprot:CAMPEP_0170283054 /NCGR_PEP_ID=MMETSP0116_2-20130129/41554_1 /TAXON_ID=400756 /ORGANISM="Durinskia baltica, Strain CSIRO CS-38" /LENGTH=209 /DNA_ID=CAMNT_0010534411 /DNA_START=20 /DNA_END=645 /DNA_ORIENTATION=-